jgi:hypothetical protein
MVKITPGESLKRYAAIYGCNLDDVVQWMEGYVNGPWADGLKSHIEPIKDALEQVARDKDNERG